MSGGVGYIVNNTGIPSSEWGKYKPAGVNPDGTPRYKDVSSIYAQTAACGRVSNLMKGLLPAELFSSKRGA